MATSPPWLSGHDECQDFSDNCHKVLQIFSAVSFQATGSIQTVCEGAAFLMCFAWKPWFWGLGGNEGGFPPHRSSLGTHQDTQQEFPSLMNSAVPTTGHASSPERWGRNGLSIQVCNLVPASLGGEGSNSIRLRGQSRNTKSLFRGPFLEPAVPSQNSLFSVLGPFFPLLTNKVNIKTFNRPLEPTSPEISALQQIQDALVCLYGFKAVKEVSWLSRIRKPSHKGFFNPFY